MSRSFASLGVVAACAVLPSLAHAGASVESLQAELAALKADYSARIAALEQRIGELETAAPPSPVDAAPQPPAPAASSANAFNPAISLILGFGG